MTKPLEQLQPKVLYAAQILLHIQKCIREVIIPSWIQKPPTLAGLPAAGVLKADNWRQLITIYIPLALMSLWLEDSPVRAENYSEMASVLETAMNLTCACSLMVRRSMTEEELELMQTCYKDHIEGLKENFPGFMRPVHHMGFHIYDFIQLFGPVHNFWCFAGERLIGKIQKIPTNHIPGQFEHTLLHQYIKGVGFRRWLLRPNAPPLLRKCQELLDKAYGFAGYKASEAATSAKKFPLELSRLLTSDERSRITLRNRIVADPGDYVVKSTQMPGQGNSYICFHSLDDSEWQTGQIEYIYDMDGKTFVVVRRNTAPNLPTTTDAFKSFWSRGFQAKLVSTSFDDNLEIVEFSQIISHVARWKLTTNFLLVLSLSEVRKNFYSG